MELTLADQYYLKALDSYPYNLEEVIESLKYALSYDSGHVQSDCLMARVCMTYLKNFYQAEYYFEEVLVADLHYVESYKYYSLLKIWSGDYNGALRLIKSGLKIPGMDRALLRQRRAMVFECMGQYADARLELKRALHTAHNDSYTEYF